MKVKELLLTGLLVLLCAMPNVAMAADTTVTRSYPFESATQENPHYTVPETVEEGGKTYTLTSVEYEMKAHREPVTVVQRRRHFPLRLCFRPPIPPAGCMPLVILWSQ